MKGFCAILTALLICLLSCTALAWVPEGRYQTTGDLPKSMRDTLANEEAFLSGIYNGDTAYLTVDAGSNARRILIFREKGGVWELISQSAPLAQVRSCDAYVGGTSPHELYLFYGGNCFTFCEEADGKWRLHFVQAEEGFFWLTNGLRWYDKEGEHYLYGVSAVRDLSALDAATLPWTLAEARGLIDTDGWAVVNNANPQDRLPLRAEPSQGAKSLGGYYSGTPVCVTEIQGDWAKVDIYGARGYMTLRYLAMGPEMERVRSAFLDRSVTEEATLRGVKIYAQPDPLAQVIGRMIDEKGYIPWGTFHIIGTIGDEWYHIVVNDGQCGYVEAKDFWEGNG